MRSMVPASNRLFQFPF